MSPCDKIIHVVYITDNTGWYNVLSMIEKHRFCKMIPVQSNISLKSISWIIFLLRSYLFPFCSAFVGTGWVFSTGFHSRMAHGKGVPGLDQCSGHCPSQPCSSPGLPLTADTDLLCWWYRAGKSSESLLGTYRQGNKKAEKSHL